jgi:hypothetical protein
MTDQSDSQIGIRAARVRFTKRDNVKLVVRGNQCPGNRFDSGGLVGKTNFRRCGTRGRLRADNRLIGHVYRKQRGRSGNRHADYSQNEFFAATDLIDMETSRCKRSEKWIHLR